MLLYHFTSRKHLRSITAGGLNRGTVHLSDATQLNAVWLTTDAGPRGHGLEGGGDFMNDRQRQEALEWSGALPPPGTRFPKDADVRISVELDQGDRELHEWLPWARRHIDPEWMAHLHPVVSGNLKKAKTWRIYTGVIPPARFVAVEELEATPAVVPLRPALPLAS